MTAFTTAAFDDPKPDLAALIPGRGLADSKFFIVKKLPVDRSPGTHLAAFPA
jgi:hypothetical protein